MVFTVKRILLHLYRSFGVLACSRHFKQYIKIPCGRSAFLNSVLIEARLKGVGLFKATVFYYLFNALPHFFPVLKNSTSKWLKMKSI